MISHTTVKNLTNKHLFNTMKINSLFVSKIIFTLLFFLLSPSKTFANVLNSYNTRSINTLRKETQKIDTLAIKLETSVIAKEINLIGPIIKFNDTIHNLGTISSKTITTYIVQFKNIGDDYLLIKKVDASCGCVQIDSFTKEPLSPGETGQIKISINPQLTHDVAIKKYIYITSNIGMHKVKFIGTINRK